MPRKKKVQLPDDVSKFAKAFHASFDRPRTKAQLVELEKLADAISVEVWGAVAVVRQKGCPVWLAHEYAAHLKEVYAATIKLKNKALYLAMTVEQADVESDLIKVLATLEPLNPGTWDLRRLKDGLVAALAVRKSGEKQKFWVGDVYKACVAAGLPVPSAMSFYEDYSRSKGR